MQESLVSSWNLQPCLGDSVDLFLDGNLHENTEQILVYEQGIVLHCS